ncbi:MAG: WD40 repeat domain-containing protein, partial [Verrucomicrobia bacterium]|nr:WD40 repeat domain-containing protein [Verrucomicrobiota bacterium]
KVLYELSTGRDRLEHPALPAFWTHAPNLTQLTELNEVVLKACEPNLRIRYGSAEELHQELVLLHAGESVKRLRLLERLARGLTKLAVLGLAVGMLAGYEILRVRRQREQESKRVADVHAAAGARIAARGDLLGSLPWYAEALRLDEQRPRRAMRHRMNLQTALRYSPQKAALFFEDAEIHDLAFSPRGTHIAEGLKDGRVLVRALREHEPLRTLLGHTGEVMSVAWSRDGKLLVSASTDRTVLIWDVETSRRLGTLRHPGEVQSAVFDREGTRVIVAGQWDSPQGARSLIRIWEWRASEVLAEHMGDSGKHRTVSISEDDRWIVVAGDDAYANVMDGSTLQPRPERLWHPPKAGAPTWVYDAQFSPNGAYLATAGFDHLARVWDLSLLQPRFLFPHDAPVHSVQFSPDRRYLLTACDDYTARIWDVQRRTEAYPALRHNSFVHKARFSPDGSLVATMTTGGIVTIWNLPTEAWRESKPAIHSPDGSHFALISTNSVQVYWTRSGSPAGRPASAPGKIRDMRFSADGGVFFLVSEASSESGAQGLTGQVYGSDGSRRGSAIALAHFVPEAPSDLIAGVSANGQRVVLVHNSTVELWDMERGAMRGKPYQHPSEAGAALSADASRMVAFCLTNALLINAATGDIIAALPHPHHVDSAQFSPDCKMLASACRDDDEKPMAAFIWDAKDGSRIGPKLQHQDGVTAATFSPDSRFLLTAGEDRVVKQWRVGSWEEVRKFRYDHGFVSAAFDRSGSKVVTAASDDTVQVWDLESEEHAGTPLTPPLRLPFNLWQARFLDDGSRVLAKRLSADRWTRGREDVSSDSAWRRHIGVGSPFDWEQSIWRLDAEPVSSRELRIMAELLSAQRIELDETTALSVGELKDRWGEASRSRALGSKQDAERLTAWHTQQAELAWQREDAFAALFHIKRLIPLVPDSAALRERAERLESILKTAKTRQ